MNHGIELAAIEPGQEIGGGHQIGKPASGKIVPFAVGCQGKSLTAMSARPASLRLATTFDPMKPAPPVTKSIRKNRWYGRLAP